MALFAILLTVTVRLTVDHVVRDHADSNIQQRLADVASFVASILSGWNDTDFEQLNQKLALVGQQTKMEISVLDAAGKIVANSSGQKDDQAQSAGLEEARRNAVASFSRQFEDQQEHVHIRRVDSDDATSHYFARVVAVAGEEVLPEFNLDKVIFLTTLPTLLFLYVLMLRPARILSELTGAVRGMAEGEFPQPRVDDAGSHDLADLATTFNSMNEKVVREIKSLNRNQAGLRSIADGLSIVLGSMVEGVVAVDSNENVLFANPAAIAVFDTPTESYLGRPIRELFRNQTLHELITAALSGTGQQVECTLSRQQKEMAIVAAPLAGEKKSGVVLVMHDVSELRRLEQMRRDFVSNVSHELKTPLSVIQACADTLMDGTIDDKNHNRDFVRQIQQHGDRLGALIRDMLQLSRIENAKATFEISKVSMQNVMRQCQNDHATVAKSQKIELQVEMPAQDIFANANLEALRTMLSNLIENAIRYTPEGGLIVVSCQCEDDTVELRVVDNGPGIPAEHLPRIFERFYRVDHARSRELGGTGLGLAIVKHLSNLMDGSISCTSEFGEGTTFILRLPEFGDSTVMDELS